MVSKNLYHKKMNEFENWFFIEKDYPEHKNCLYTVVDKYGTVERGVLFGCSGFMNEPWSFFDGEKIKGHHIVAYKKE